MHSFVFGSRFCHFCSFWKIWVPPTHGLKYAAACRGSADFSWGPLVLVNDQQFIEELEKYLVKDACAWNNNPRAKPKSSNMKSNLIYKHVFADFL